MSELDQPEDVKVAAADEEAGPDGATPPAALGSAVTTTVGTFWQCGPGVHALDDPTPFGQENALQKLGKPPFEKTTRGRFRLLGYLATVYEHVSQDVAGKLPIDSAAPGEALPEPSTPQATSEEVADETARFVVLRHTGHGSDHFDLMIESDPAAEGLATWRASEWPLSDGTALTPLGPHRRAYLDYEGPVSGGRGEVRRVAAGQCRVREGADGLIVRFDGEDGAWQLGEVARRISRYDPASNDGA